MTRASLYLLLAAAMVLAGLACLAGTALVRRMDRRARTLGLVASAVAFLALLPAPMASVWPLSLAALLGLGVLGGTAIGRGLVNADAVVAFLVVVAVVDVASFSGGPTALVVEAYREGSSELLLHLALTFPLRGRMVPLIGVGDLVVLSAVAEATRRLGFSVGELALAFGAALLVALGVGLAVGGIYFLPFLCLAVAPWLLLRKRSAGARSPDPSGARC